MAADEFALWYEEDAARLDALAQAAREKGYVVRAAKGAKKTEDGAESQPSGRSLWQNKVHFSGWAEARSLTISIDFDRTFAADPRLWGEFAKSASEDGNTVVMITRRDDTDRNRTEIEDTIGDYADAFDSVILAGPDTQKEAAAEAAGIAVDIWVDDSPQTIKSRAWCEGASPPDNSCSPANKGDGGESSIPSASSLERVKSLGGSTGAALMQDADGNQYVVKGGNSPEHIRSEAAANAIYKAAGIRVPEFRLDEENPQAPKQVARFIEAKPLAETTGRERARAIEELKQGFAADALLANWDVIGLEEDNVLVSKDGKAYRADNGGSLRFRAQGSPKEFGREVRELDTLRESDQGAPIFGDLSNEEVASQIRKISSRRRQIVRAAPPDLRETIGSRIDYMEEWASENGEARAFCPTGEGGGVDNSCSSQDGDGDDGEEGGGDSKSPFTEKDAEAPKTKVKTKDGREIEVADRKDASNSEYLDEVEEDGESKGLVVDHDTARERMQASSDIEEESGPYAAFVGAAYPYFSDFGTPDSSADDEIDMQGFDYGTISEDGREEYIQTALDEMWSGTDPQTEFGLTEEQWNELGSDGQQEKIDEWRDENYSIASDDFDQRREEARGEAIQQMRRDLESNLASAELECCVQLYRGISIGEDVVQRMIEEGVVSHTGTNSWTTSRDSARNFGGTKCVLVCRAPAVGHVNQADNLGEKEITRPPSTMKITAAVKTSTGYVLYVEEDEDYAPDQEGST